MSQDSLAHLEPKGMGYTAYRGPWGSLALLAWTVHLGSPVLKGLLVRTDSREPPDCKVDRAPMGG